jgi:hypothetical protein
MTAAIVMSCPFLLLKLTFFTVLDSLTAVVPIVNLPSRLHVLLGNHTETIGGCPVWRYSDPAYFLPILVEIGDFPSCPARSAIGYAIRSIEVIPVSRRNIAMGDTYPGLPELRAELTRRIAALVRAPGEQTTANPD